MPASALLGAFLVAFAFMVSKLIIPGVILPIGLIAIADRHPVLLCDALSEKGVVQHDAR